MDRLIPLSYTSIQFYSGSFQYNSTSSENSESILQVESEVFSINCNQNKKTNCMGGGPLFNDQF
jgi:hypothetical protein